MRLQSRSLTKPSFWGLVEMPKPKPDCPQCRGTGWCWDGDELMTFMPAKNSKRKPEKLMGQVECSCFPFHTGDTRISPVHPS